MKSRYLVRAKNIKNGLVVFGAESTEDAIRSAQETSGKKTPEGTLIDPAAISEIDLMHHVMNRGRKHSGGSFYDCEKCNPKADSRQEERASQTEQETYENVDLIAAGYEWTCPHEGCEHLNSETEVKHRVTCSACGRVCITNPPNHAY